MMMLYRLALCAKDFACGVYLLEERIGLQVEGTAAIGGDRFILVTTIFAAFMA